MKILVVHPERDIADSIADILDAHGFNTLPVYDDVDAWDAVQGFVFEVALVSTEMPGWTGFELGDWLWCASQESGRWLATVRIGPDEAGYFESEFEEHVTRYLKPNLPLPCATEELVSKVREAFEHQQRMEIITERHAWEELGESDL